jgi:iron(III) transport system substrate-binding protein
MAVAAVVFRNANLVAAQAASFVAALVASGCQAGNKSAEVVAYTSVDQVFSEPIFRHCQDRAGVSVRGVFDTEETKSTGVLNRLIAESSRPQADVFWSGDPVRPFMLIERGFVQPYASPEAGALPQTLRAPDGWWTGFAARARVFLVNNTLVPDSDTPGSIRDLANARWKGKAAIANPLFGTTTMHVAALFSSWGEEQSKAFFDELKTNGVRIASSNGEVKRWVASGEVAFGLTDTDDANEAIQTGAPVRVVYPDRDGIGTLVMPTVAVLIKGAPHSDNGKKLIDCLLSADVEQRMAETAAHMPLRVGVPTPASVQPLSAITAMQVDYKAVAQTMEQIQPWLREWTGL